MQRPCWFQAHFQEVAGWHEFDFVAKFFLQSLIDHQGELSDFAVRSAICSFDGTKSECPGQNEIDEAKRQAKLFYVTHTAEESRRAAKRDSRVFFLPTRVDRKIALEDIQKQIKTIPLSFYDKWDIAKKVEQNAYEKASGDIDFPAILYTGQVLAELECLWLLAEIVALKGLLKNRGLARQDKGKLRRYAFKKANCIEKKKKKYISRHLSHMGLCPQCGMHMLWMKQTTRRCVRCECQGVKRLYKASHRILVNK